MFGKRYRGITSAEFKCLLICVGLHSPSNLVEALLQRRHEMTQNFFLPVGGSLPVCLSLERKGMLTGDGECLQATEKGIRTLSNFLGISIVDVRPEKR